MLLILERILENYGPTKATKVYVDDGPVGVPVTVAQLHKLQKVNQPPWRSVAHASHPKTASEINYGKVGGESLALFTRIQSKNVYLYGTKFTMVIDHEPLVALDNSQWWLFPFRVAKSKSWRRGFNFNALCELRCELRWGGLPHHLNTVPDTLFQYSNKEWAELQIEDEKRIDNSKLHIWSSRYSYSVSTQESI